MLDKKKVIILTQRVKISDDSIEILKKQLDEAGYKAIILPFGVEKVNESYL